MFCYAYLNLVLDICHLCKPDCYRESTALMLTPLWPLMVPDRAVPYHHSFLYSLEPFPQHIRINQDVKGVQPATYHHKVAA